MPSSFIFNFLINITYAFLNQRVRSPHVVQTTLDSIKAFAQETWRTINLSGWNGFQRWGKVGTPRQLINYAYAHSGLCQTEGLVPLHDQNIRTQKVKCHNFYNKVLVFCSKKNSLYLVSFWIERILSWKEAKFAIRVTII